MKNLVRCLLLSVAWLASGSAQAALILDYQASQDDGLNGVWENSQGITDRDWSLNGATHVAVVDAASRGGDGG